MIIYVSCDARLSGFLGSEIPSQRADVTLVIQSEYPPSDEEYHKQVEFADADKRPSYWSATHPS